MIMKGRVARGWIRQDLGADSESTLTTARGSCRLISIQMIIMQTKDEDHDYQDHDYYDLIQFGSFHLLWFLAFPFVNSDRHQCAQICFLKKSF